MDIMRSYLNACKKQDRIRQADGTCNFAHIPFIHFNKESDEQDDITLRTTVWAQIDDFLDSSKQLAHEKGLLAGRIIASQLQGYSDEMTSCRHVVPNDDSHATMTCFTKMPKNARYKNTQGAGRK